jgi:hypothetical protein
MPLKLVEAPSHRLGRARWRFFRAASPDASQRDIPSHSPTYRFFGKNPVYGYVGVWSQAPSGGDFEGFPVRPVSLTWR